MYPTRVEDCTVVTALLAPTLQAHSIVPEMVADPSRSRTMYTESVAVLMRLPQTMTTRAIWFALSRATGSAAQDPDGIATSPPELEAKVPSGDATPCVEMGGSMAKPVNPITKFPDGGMIRQYTRCPGVSAKPLIFVTGMETVSPSKMAVRLSSTLFAIVAMRNVHVRPNERARSTSCFAATLINWASSELSR